MPPAIQSFWNQFARPIIGLSPMDGVTDFPYRHVYKKYGNPDVIITEFTSVEGVCHQALTLLQDFLFDKTQRPVVAQIYGTTPEFFRQTTILLCHLGFDGIDINMGCPAKNVAHSGAGAALIKTPQLAQNIIKAVKQGVNDYLNGQRPQDCHDISASMVTEVEKRHQFLPTAYQEPRPLPVSVKTRIGYETESVETWIPYLLEMEPAVISLHGRTLKQQYGGLADWDAIGKAAELIKPTTTLLLGNGDIASRDDALDKINTYHLDGALIGRASFGNPFIFLPPNHKPTATKFEVAIEHAKLFEKTYGHKPNYNFMPMRKHLGWYVREIPGASEIRVKLFQAKSSQDVITIFNEYHLI